MLRGVSKLFRFATFGDKMLIVLGSMFAFIEGAGPPGMALVFGGMTNTLVDLAKFGFGNNQAANNTAAQPQPSAAANITPTDAVNQIIFLDPVSFESRMASYSILYVFLGIIVYVSSLIQVSCWQTACEYQIHRVRRAFFRSVLRQELAWFDQHQSGELSSKFNDDIERIRDGIGEQFSSIIKFSSSFLTGFVVGFAVSWRLTLVIITVTPLLALFSAYLGRLLATSTRREQEKYAKAGALAEEVLTTIRTVFALGGQRQEIRNYTKCLNESKRMAQRKYLKLGLVLGCSMFVLYASYGLALYYASKLLLVDKITAGSAMTVIMAVMMGASALGNIIPPLQTVAISLSSAGLIYEIIDSQPRIDALNDRGLKLAKVTANIKFEQVSFSYPTRRSRRVLKDLNFELNQGQTVAICGKTGSGKSTIMNLLLRFYDPDDGVIYLDNCDLRDFNVAWLRSLAGVVEQEPSLFDCSIFENIALGACQEWEKSYERVIEAAKLANAHEFIVNFPDGYNTRCGDRGVQMSGGQKQRIAIARALLSDPKILLLDEATSALDSESEYMVQSALNRARQGRTTIIIAHRLSTIRDADLICVMDDGRLVEMGQHDELMAKKSHYHNLVTNQVFNEERTPTEEPQFDTSGIPAGSQRLAGSLSKTHGSLSQTISSPSKSPEMIGRVIRPGDSDLDFENNPYQATSTTTSTTLINQQLQQQCAQSKTGSSRFLQGFSPLTRSSDIPYEELSSQSKSFSGKKHSTSLYESVNKPIKDLVEYQNGNNDHAEQATIADILRLAKPEMPLLIVSIIASILSGALMPTFALFYAQIFDTFSKTGDELIASGVFWALMFVALAAANFIVMFFRVTFMAWTIENVMARVRSDCYTNILRQHVGWFDNPKNSPQRLTTRLAADVPQIKAVLNTRMSTFISGLATIVAALIIAFYIGWKLAILLTIALPILLYVGFLQMRISRGDRVQHLKRMENASKLATESIEHVKLIQSINQERYFFDKFNNELRGPMKDALSSARRFGFVYGLSQSVIFFVYGASFRWGAHLMAKQELDPLSVFRVFFSIAFTAVAVGQWGGMSGDVSRANQAIGLIMKLLNTQPAIDNLSRGGIKPQLKGLVRLQDVHFKYPTRPETTVLQNINLQVNPGETLALVGPSGNGKSTIASLLLRFYDPDKGVVRIDNYDIRCINLNHLRMNIGLVSQEPCLFRASIKENILYGLDKSRYTMRDVVSAARLANIHDFINSLPDSYDTQVGDRGTQLSGGQKQRIAIARVLIRNPTVLILDEATSALDAESEAVVSQALDRAAKGKTCIKIAHRLSTIRDADQIAVIEGGQIVELGNHEQLMALGSRGHYYKLMQKQDISS